MMGVSIVNQLLSLLVTILYVNEVSASDMMESVKNRKKPLTVCNKNETPFYLELMTDDFPRSTSWELIDISSNQTIYYVEQGVYSQSSSLNDEVHCILSDLCYKFIIRDSGGDGICCSHGVGFYKITYDDAFVGEGGEFGSSEESRTFGGACSNLSLNKSFVPSAGSQTPRRKVLYSSSTTSSVAQLCSGVFDRIYYYYDANGDRCYQLTLSSTTSSTVH